MAADRTLGVDWVDGDSGTLSTGERFRLHGVDAPESGPTRAQCAHEREQAKKARAAARELTDGKLVRITRSHGHERYGRELLSLSQDGRDIAEALVGSGYLQRWNFEAGHDKPSWCR